MSESDTHSSDSESVEFFFESDDSEIDNGDVDECVDDATNRTSLRSRVEEFTTPEERIRKMIEMKGMKLLGDETRWREAVRQQMESELTRRVREALETPPLERTRKRADVASQQRDTSDINSRLLLDAGDRDRDFSRAKRWRSHQNSRVSDTGGLVVPTASHELRYLLPDHLYHSNPELRSDGFRPYAASNGNTDAPDKYSACVSQCPDLKSKAHSFYNKKGFIKSLRLGSLPAGPQVCDDREAYVDKFGIIRTNDGPFWPPEAVPLFATPRFKCWVVATPEPLFDFLSCVTLGDQANV